MEEGFIIDQDQFGEGDMKYQTRDNFYGFVDENNNIIHPTAIIGDNVVLGKNNCIGAYCVISGRTIIGDDNKFEAFVSIGSSPEHREFVNKPNEIKGVKIGNGNIFREFVTVNSGCTQDTVVANECWLLKGSHVGHDSFIGSEVTLSCNVLIGGYSYVMKGANMGLGAVCHQRSVIGSYSMVGMNSTITKKDNIYPFMTYAGSPVKLIGHNIVKEKLFSSEFIEYTNNHYFETVKSIKQDAKS